VSINRICLPIKRFLFVFWDFHSSPIRKSFQWRLQIGFYSSTVEWKRICRAASGHDLNHFIVRRFTELLILLSLIFHNIVVDHSQFLTTQPVNSSWNSTVTLLTGFMARTFKIFTINFHSNSVYVLPLFMHIFICFAFVFCCFTADKNFPEFSYEFCLSTHELRIRAKSGESRNDGDWINSLLMASEMRKRENIQ
jgi:hypothetical protein